MRYGAGRFFQVLGMLIMPIGMAGNVLNKETVTEKHVLMTATVGLAMFGLGLMIQGRKPN